MLIKDGVAVTSMNVFVAPDIAHALLCVARFVQALGGDAASHVVTSAWLLIAGNGALVELTHISSNL